jgi:hypothetical protein
MNMVVQHVRKPTNFFLMLLQDGAAVNTGQQLHLMRRLITSLIFSMV